MGIKSKRNLSLTSYSKRDIQEAKRYLGYYIASYVSGEMECTYCFTTDKLTSDKIKDVIVKYFRYMDSEVACTYRFFAYYSLTLYFPVTK